MMITLNQVTKSYPAWPTPTVILSAINLEVAAGQFVAIMGNSGSGKSSLLNIISGFTPPDTGTIKIDGQVLSSASRKALLRVRRNSIGFIFQDYQLISHLSLWENVLVAGFLHSRPRREIINRADYLFKKFELFHARHRLPAHVSGGEQQRAAIVRAIINQPPVLLADEPTGNLHSAASTRILQYFLQLHQEGQTILMVTHDPAAAAYAQRIILLQDGKIIEEKTGKKA